MESSQIYNELQDKLLSVIEDDEQVLQIIDICHQFFTEKRKASAREAMKKSRKNNSNSCNEYSRQYYQEHKEELNRKRTELNRRKRVEA
jgi:hypothetical protein